MSISAYSYSSLHKTTTHPTCYMICKTGSYLLHIFLCYKLAHCGVQGYVFLQKINQCSFIHMPSIIASAIIETCKNIYHIPIIMLKIGITHVLLSAGMYISNPYEDHETS